MEGRAKANHDLRHGSPCQRRVSTEMAGLDLSARGWEEGLGETNTMSFAPHPHGVLQLPRRRRPRRRRSWFVCALDTLTVFRVKFNVYDPCIGLVSSWRQCSLWFRGIVVVLWLFFVVVDSLHCR